jgi:hypothetical protein
MNNILIYTFFNYTRKTSKGLYELDAERYHVDKLFIPNTFSTKKLLEAIPSYEYVIGIADQNRNAKQSRFDPKYVNRYGRRLIIENGEEEYASNWDIELPEGFYKYRSITNGPCNRSAYLVMNEVISNQLDTRFGFFHLCKDTVKEDLEKILLLIPSTPKSPSILIS